jgi:aminomethyltransferase
MTSEENIKRTCLYQEHIALNAKMAEFGGWDMPIQYEGIIAEYNNTRNGVSIFDVSHMGEFILEGDPVKTGLDRIVTMRIVDMPLNTCRYGMILNETGGIIDDLIVFRTGTERWFIVVNAATTEKDADHFRNNLAKGAVFKDISTLTGKIDLQGPRSRDILSAYVTGLNKLDYYTFDFFHLLGENVLISRTGYTGELGYEIYFPWTKTPDLWRELLKSGDVKPAGLGARDILRLEMGYPLYGHELSEAISPLETGLMKFVDLEKDFIGKETLLQLKERCAKRKTVAFVSDDRRSPRSGQRVFDKDANEIGIVTSGSFSPYLGKGIGLALISKLDSSKGEVIYFGEMERSFPAKISERVLYKDGTLKS